MSETREYIEEQIAKNKEMKAKEVINQKMTGPIGMLGFGMNMISHYIKQIKYWEKKLEGMD